MLADFYERVFEAAKPPPWMKGSLCHFVRLGSAAFGAAGPRSDFDLFGVCAPPIEEAFPGQGSNIMGFDDECEPFGHWKAEHVRISGDVPASDITIYGLTGFLKGCRDATFGMIESLYTDHNLTITASVTSEHIRDRRAIFLSKTAARRMLRAARTHYVKMNARRKPANMDRALLVNLHGYDTKDAYHIVRLLLEAEMVLTEQTLDLTRNRELLLQVRSGAWDYAALVHWIERQTLHIQEAADRSTLREECDHADARALVLECLEQNYGDLEHIGLRSSRRAA